MRLKDKVAIITGSGSGIGRASAVAFSKEGAKVVVVDVNDDGGNETVDLIKENGGDAVFIHVDISKEKEVQNMVDIAVNTYGKLDILFNNAAILPSLDSPLIDVTEEEWDKYFNINVKGLFFGCKYAVPEMKKVGKGAIINTAALAGVLPSGGRTQYNTTKGAGIVFTKSLAMEVAQFGIRVNAIGPGPTLTAAMKDKLAQEGEAFKGGRSSQKRHLGMNGVARKDGGRAGLGRGTGGLFAEGELPDCRRARRAGDSQLPAPVLGGRENRGEIEWVAVGVRQHGPAEFRAPPSWTTEMATTDASACD